MPGYGAYDASTGKLASYQKELISLPNVGGSVDGANILSGSAFEYWNNWQATILRKIPARRDTGKVPRAPYSDPALVKSPGLYAEFIANLIRIGVVTLRPRKRKHTVGVFS